MKQPSISWLALWLALVMAMALAGCARSAEVDTLQQRVQRLETQSPHVVKLEQRVASLEAAARRIETLIGALGAQADGQDGQDGQGGQAAMDSRLELLARRLDDIERKVASGAAGAVPAQPGPPRARTRPDPDDIYSVPVGNSPFRGPRDAKVTMIRSFEFACPYCERSRATMDQLVKDYGKDLRIVYKHFIVHPQVATEPALAACAAHEQGRFFDMERAIWDRGYLAGRDLSVANMDSIARDLGLDMNRFKRDMNGAACDRQVKDDQALLKQVGATGTPAFFINGRFLSGARPIDHFKAVIDLELARADRIMREKKIKQRDYYDHVVKTGKTSP